MSAEIIRPADISSENAPAFDTGIEFAQVMRPHLSLVPAEQTADPQTAIKEKVNSLMAEYGWHQLFRGAEAYAVRTGAYMMAIEQLNDEVGRAA